MPAVLDKPHPQPTNVPIIRFWCFLRCLLSRFLLLSSVPLLPVCNVGVAAVYFLICFAPDTSVFPSENVFHSSVFTLFLVSCQQLSSNPPNSSFVSLQLTKVFECFHVSLSVFRSRKCQTRIKGLGKTYKNLWGLKLNPPKHLASSSENIAFLEVAFEKRIHDNTEQRRDRTTSRMRRCGPQSRPQSRPLTMLSHHPPPPPFLSSTPAMWPKLISRTRAAKVPVIYPKSGSQMVRRRWRKKDVVANAERPAFPSDEHTEGAEKVHVAVVPQRTLPHPPHFWISITNQ